MKAQVIIIALVLALPTQAQMTSGQIKLLEAELDGRGKAETQRLTSHGKFSGCELTFQHSFRDNRSGPEAKLLNVVGSISSRWIPGRPFNFFVKAKPSRISIAPDASVKFDVFDPGYVGLGLGVLSIEKHRQTRFQCEGGGECVVYSDNNNFDLLKSMVTDWPNGPVIYLTVIKNGQDQQIAINKLQNGPTALTEFYGCTNEIIEELRQWATENLK